MILFSHPQRQVRTHYRNEKKKGNEKMLNHSNFDHAERQLSRGARIARATAAIIAASALIATTFYSCASLTHSSPTAPNLKQKTARAALVGGAAYMKYARCFIPTKTERAFSDPLNRLGNGRGCGMTGQKPDLKLCYEIMAHEQGLEGYRGCAQAIDSLLSQ